MSQYGHSIEWKNEKGERIDFAADSLRAKAESQGKLHQVVAELRF